MLGLLAEAALRAMALGAFAWLGLKVMRVHHPRLQMTAWTVVLVISLAMPILVPWMQVSIQTPPAPPSTVKITWTDLPGITTDMRQRPERVGIAARTETITTAPSRGDKRQWWPIALYLVVSGTLLLRLLLGLTLMWRVVRASRPLRSQWADVDVRVSEVVTVPVTFASIILMPVGYKAWSPRKLEAALLHEKSHVCQRDFYVLLLASINRAVFWFSPFAWWLSVRLEELAEAVSDDAAIAGLGGDRDGYADILAAMAATRQRLPAGLAMAHPRTVHRRVIRIRAESSVPRQIGYRPRLGVALALIPLATLSAVSVAPGHTPALPSPAVLLEPHGESASDHDVKGLDRYVGQYQIGIGSVLEITRRGDRLFEKWSGQPTLELTRTGADEFVNTEGRARVSFAGDDDGAASQVTFWEPDLNGLIGTRVDAATAAELAAMSQRRNAIAPERFRDQKAIPGGDALLARTIEALRGDALNEQDLAGHLPDKLRRQLPMLQRSLSALGAVKQIDFLGVGPGGYDIYRAKFVQGQAGFRLFPAPDGRLEDVNFEPFGDGRPGGMVSCTEELTNIVSSAVPIRLTLINRSGDEVQLFWLSPTGERVPYGTIENDASLLIWSPVDRPFVIADTTGQCRNILLPGETTRVHVIEPMNAPAALRATPLPGSREALARHIEAVRRGAPDFDQMTPEAAAKMRLNLAQHQDLLTRLGALEELQFRGVIPGGTDLYTAKFANGSVTWQIGMLADGRIGSVGPGPR